LDTTAFFDGKRVFRAGFSLALVNFVGGPKRPLLEGSWYERIVSAERAITTPWLGYDSHEPLARVRFDYR